MSPSVTTSAIDPEFRQRVWQSQAALHLASALSGRHTALQSMQQASPFQREAALNLLEEAELLLCETRAEFVGAVRDLHQHRGVRSTLLSARQQAFDALFTLWDFEADWEKVNRHPVVADDELSLMELAGAGRDVPKSEDILE